jgi:hypothetical protein
MGKWVAVLVLMGAGTCLVAQEPDPKPQEPSQLDKDLAAALSNNPDIQVAEAQLQEAQAELNRVRLGVMQKVAALRIDIDAQKRLLEATEEDYARTRALIESGVVPQGEVQASAVALEKARADLARLEAELSAMKGEVHGVQQDAANTQSAIDKGLFWLRHHQWGHPEGNLAAWFQSGNMADCAACHTAVHPVDPHASNTAHTLLALGFATQAKPEPGSMTDRILTALDTPIAMEGAEEALLQDFLELLRHHSDIPFRTLIGSTGGQPISLMEGELPLGAWLLVVEDSFPDVNIYIRPYGLLVTTSESPPEGAVPLHAAWPKREQAKDEQETTAPEN